ncbi:PAS domain-containing sensor histidine kinase [Mucilaginibacter sp. PPCGB 2223]|uniref:PAS domain-containing sensor histidine kinase n=1 Tax=Mucilaginibacter sp. PPCGB 2223 TaxID=1886027 RepID=UPI0008249288|nr:PAS domain-containing sensor histidine kinase [Mucilaginibacter sp. PPCGB 2223]OCX53894.1 PAS domain-containing sensor histidine kinase [Mucilaginibacter sp. PPCGB 2223]
MSKATLLKAIIQNVVDSVIVIDHHGIIMFVNPAVSTLFGYTEDELIGQKINMLMQKADAHQHDHYLSHYQITGKAAIIGKGREVTAVKKDGTIFPIRLAVSEAKYKGKPLYAGLVHDLTKEKRAEADLKKHNSELEAIVDERTVFLKNIVQTLEQAKDEVSISLQKEKEVNQLKTRFVSMASHEFRTPLSGIQLSASLIEHYYDKLDKQKILNHLKKIKAAVGDLTSILNDFLSVERIEAGKLKPSYSNFDLHEICLEVIEEMQLQIKDGQKISYHHKRGSTNICLDNTLLRHCLINLLSNAIKYSDENGQIDIITDVDQQNYYITVKDNGIGIPEDEHDKLFEAFFRAQNTGTVQGTGLGLNIVKRYAELMNGSITFESMQHKGTSFTLSFPVHQMERLSTTHPAFEPTNQECG